MVLAARRARAKTLGAIGLLAFRARDGTGWAERAATLLAAVAIFLVNNVAAIIATDAVPPIEFHVGAAPAVVAEHLGYQRKEVVEPAIGQGVGNRRAALAFTEALILDVRMGNVLITGRRVRIDATTR